MSEFLQGFFAGVPCWGMLGLLAGCLLMRSAMGEKPGYEAAKKRFAARLCPHGIVDTGWCEECQREKANV